MPFSEAVAEVVENLRWYTRRRVVDAPINRLTVAWENRFRAQGRYFARHCVTLLPATEARKPDTPDTVDAALSKFEGFTFSAAVRVYEETVPEVFAAGAMQTVRDVGALTTYTIKSPLVADYLEAHSAAKMGKDVDATTKGLVRDKLVQGYAEGWSRSKITKEIKGLFDGFAKRDASSLYRNRAEVIAVNELGTAYSQGALQGALAIEDSTGMVLEKSWAVAANPCAMCSGNAAQGWIPLKQLFSGGQSAPTGHPRCRCSLLTRVKPQA